VRARWSWNLPVEVGLESRLRASAPRREHPVDETESLRLIGLSCALDARSRVFWLFILPDKSAWGSSWEGRRLTAWIVRTLLTGPYSESTSSESLVGGAEKGYVGGLALVRDRLLSQALPQSLPRSLPRCLPRCLLRTPHRTTTDFVPNDHGLCRGLRRFLVRQC